jgi:tetratricopeptide (TPR) repeat protein
MKQWKGIVVAVVAFFAMFVTVSAFAQENANATVHGHVTNPAGLPQTVGNVEFTKDLSGGEFKGRKITNSFPIDSSGNFKGGDVAPGDYLVAVVAEDKSLDFQRITIKAGEDKTLDFDMSRADYIAKMTPEEKKQLEEFKAKNAAVSEDNKKIANLNATIAAVRADLAKNKAPVYGDVSQDVAQMKAAVDAKPDESVLWINYAETLKAQGDHLAYADKQAHKPVADDADAMKAYSDAIDAYKKSIDLNAASKKPNPADQAAAWNGVGNTLSAQGKPQDAAAAYENAVKIQPQNAAMFYGNEAAVLFNAGQADAAAAAADKAIAADPTRPDPYFIKGQALVQKATVDPKTNLPVAPPGCLEAYQKYLQLAPDGPNAASVREILAGFGQKIDTKYNAKKH